MHLLYKVHFWARKEKIFRSKNITKSHAIFFLREVAKVQRKFRNYLMIFGAIKIGVAFEL